MSQKCVWLRGFSSVFLVQDAWQGAFCALLAFFTLPIVTTASFDTFFS